MGPKTLSVIPEAGWQEDGHYYSMAGHRWQPGEGCGQVPAGGI